MAVALPPRPDKLKITQKAMHKIRDMLSDNNQILDVNINQTVGGEWYVEITVTNRDYRDMISQYIGTTFEDALVICRIPFFEEVQDRVEQVMTAYEPVPPEHRAVHFSPIK